MADDRTFAADVETKGDPAELAKHKSLDAERAKAKGKPISKEEDGDAAVANAGSQTGQT
jgi:hypothetical protein